MNRVAIMMLSVIVLTSMVKAGAGPSDDSRLSRWTIDSGGATFSTGGAWELSGTIGQPDAGIMEDSGSTFTLTGGFWFELPPSDCNSDGVVNLYDYGDLEPCVSGPDGGLLMPECNCFDLDGDNDVDLSDAARLQVEFTGE